MIKNKQCLDFNSKKTSLLYSEELTKEQIDLVLMVKNYLDTFFIGNTFDQVLNLFPEINEILVFGSQTRFQNHEMSDIDIMLVPKDVYNWRRHDIEKILVDCYQLLLKKLQKNVPLDLKLDLDDCEFSGYSIFYHNDTEYVLDDYCFYPENVGSVFSYKKNAIPEFICYTDLKDIFEGSKFINPK